MVVIEHNLDVVKTRADWILDFGPRGRRRRAARSSRSARPEDVAANEGELDRPVS